MAGLMRSEIDLGRGSNGLQLDGYVHTRVIEAGSGSNRSLTIPGYLEGCTRRVRRTIAAFHRDEVGLSIIEIILIIFVAVVILIALASFFNQTVWAKVKDIINRLLGTNIT